LLFFSFSSNQWNYIISILLGFVFTGLGIWFQWKKAPSHEEAKLTGDGKGTEMQAKV
jgi:hypothetical protein